MATYQIDPKHTAAHFNVRHMMISNVKGEFSGITGTIEFDPADLALSHVEATITAETVSTRESDTDKHLKSADFLDVRRYPFMTFSSTKIVLIGDGRYDLTGDLTIREVTREITLQVESLTPEVKDPDGQFRRGASGSTRIERKDFGLTWNKLLETGGAVVGDEITISIDVEATHKNAPMAGGGG